MFKFFWYLKSIYLSFLSVILLFSLVLFSLISYFMLQAKFSIFHSAECMKGWCSTWKVANMLRNASLTVGSEIVFIWSEFLLQWYIFILSMHWIAGVIKANWRERYVSNEIIQMIVPNPFDVTVAATMKLSIPESLAATMKLSSPESRC